MKNLIVLLVGLIPIKVLAGSITLIFTPPTHNTDGSVLTDLAGYVFYYGTESGVYTSDVRVEDPTISSYVIEDVPSDTYYIVATAFNLAGIESVYSNEAVKTVLDAPTQPTDLIVSDVTVYTVLKIDDAFALIPVGTVPPDTQCDPDNYVNGKYVVPLNTVSFSGTIRPNVVVADCQ